MAGELDRQRLVGATDRLGAIERPSCFVLEPQLECRLRGAEQRACPFQRIGERVGEQRPAVQRAFVFGQLGGERRDRLLERQGVGCVESDLVGCFFELP